MNTYNHIQSEPSTEWTIDHNLSGYPVTDVMIDLNGKIQKVLPKAVEYVDPNTVIVRFTEERTGTVRLVAQAGFILDLDDPTVETNPS